MQNDVEHDVECVLTVEVPRKLSSTAQQRHRICGRGGPDRASINLLCPIGGQMWLTLRLRHESLAEKISRMERRDVPEKEARSRERKT
jgi:hypothetical protein